MQVNRFHKEKRVKRRTAIGPCRLTDYRYDNTDDTGIIKQMQSIKGSYHISEHKVFFYSSDRVKLTSKKVNFMGEKCVIKERSIVNMMGNDSGNDYEKKKCILNEKKKPHYL